MPSKTFADFWWDFLLVAIIGGAVAQIIASLIIPYFQRRLGIPPSRTEVVPRSTITIPKRWYPRMWLYYIVGLAVLVVSLLLWTAFWHPLLDASIIAGLPLAYQILIPVISALLYIAVAGYLFGFLLAELLHYEAQFQQKNYERRRFFYKYAVPLGAVCGSVAIIEASFVGFELLRGRMILTPDELMLLVYASIFGIGVIWLVLMFLLKTPLLLRAFEEGESSAESGKAGADEDRVD